MILAFKLGIKSLLSYKVKLPTTVVLPLRYFHTQLPVQCCVANKELLKKKIKQAEAMVSRSDPVVTRLESPEFRSLFTPELNILAELFQKNGYELRMVGGAVRDLLLGMCPKDLDFATDATPQEMKDMFSRVGIRMININGEKHGTITPRINDKENFEITTLRVDVVGYGRRADVMFTKNWKLDANRRDLTINSMFLDLNGNVYDYFYGYEDLKKRRVAFVGDAECRIQEDYLRILRYFRFYGRITEEPDNHDEDTLQAIKNNVAGLERISGERIWSEWHRILTGKYACNITVKMIECGLAPYIGLPKEPNVEAMKLVCARAIESQLTLQPITIIAALLRDETQAMNLQARLKLSVYDRRLALFLMQHRERKPCEKPLRPYQLLVVLSTRAAETKSFVCEVLKYIGSKELLRDFETWNHSRFPLNGHMIMSLLPHPKMTGQVMISLKELWMDSDCKATAEELLDHVPKIVMELQEKKL